MKKLITLIFVTVAVSTFNSCDSYHSLNNATKVSQLSANPFLQNIAKGLLRNMGNMLIQNGIKNVGSKLGLGSNLSSILSTAQAVSGFKNMLSSNYGIATGAIDRNYSKLNTIKDVVGLIAANGTKGLTSYLN
jgi:hypothetical protein